MVEVPLTNSLPRTGPSVVSRSLPFQSEVIQRVQTCLVYAVARPSVCLSSVTLCSLLSRLKFLAMFLRHLVPWSSVTSMEILQRSSQGNLSVGGQTQEG